MLALWQNFNAAWETFLFISRICANMGIWKLMLDYEVPWKGISGDWQIKALYLRSEHFFSNVVLQKFNCNHKTFDFFSIFSDVSVKKKLMIHYTSQ